MTAAFDAVAAVLVVRAAARAFAVRHLPLDEAAARLRAVPVLDRAWMRQPERLAHVLERMLRFLPPYRHGRCLRRTMILMDLWARCGLEPRLHLGFGDSRRGHAWVSGGGLSSPRLDAREMVSL